MADKSVRETVARSDYPSDFNESGAWETVGDAADQAERLSMVMEAEAVHAALNGGGGEGTLDLPYPLEDLESVLAMEDAEDSSDDPMHAGGMNPTPWVSAEEAAIRVVDPDNPFDAAYFTDETDAERADPDHDQFEGPAGALTPEDETLLGVDPYEGNGD